MRARHLLAAIVLAAPLGAAAAGSASPPGVAQKQGEATRVLAEIAQIDRELSTTVDAYDGARVQLAALGGELRRNRVELGRARRTLREARLRLARRIVLIYTSEQPTTIDILFGASSLGDFVDRLHAAHAGAPQDDESARQAAAAQADLDPPRAPPARAPQTPQQPVPRRRRRERPPPPRLRRPPRRHRGWAEVIRRRRRSRPAISECRTSGAARHQAASTAPGSSCTSTRSSASRFRTTRSPSIGWGSR